MEFSEVIALDLTGRSLVVWEFLIVAPFAALSQLQTKSANGE